MIAKFQTNEFVSIAVPNHPISIKHYLRQPQRLIHALTEQSKIEEIPTRNLKEGHHVFRLKMQPLHFLQLTIQPVVDMEVWSDATGTVNLRSLKTEIRGTEYINQRFALNLAGKLQPQVNAAQKSKLVGEVNLKVQVDIPPILLLTPPMMLDIAGNSLLKSVLGTMKQRLTQRIVADYINWAEHDANRAVYMPGQTIANPA